MVSNDFTFECIGPIEDRSKLSKHSFREGTETIDLVLSLVAGSTL